MKHLNHQGFMYFTCFSDEDKNNGIGRHLEDNTYEYKPGKYAHFFSDEDLRNHFIQFDIMETGSTVETLSCKGNQTKEYALRYIIVQKR